jgi:hypothetical protein
MWIQTSVHYDGSSTRTPVTNAYTIQIVLILMIMANWQGQIVDVKGAFLHGEFKEGEVIYMVPHGYEKFYPDDLVLKLKKCIYGLNPFLPGAKKTSGNFLRKWHFHDFLPPYTTLPKAHLPSSNGHTNMLTL